MVRTCAQCHSSRVAEESLRQADAVKDEGNRFLAGAVEVITALHAEGIIAGGNDGELRLGGEQVLADPAVPESELLNRFYRMWRFHYNSTWKGAYHSSFSISNLQSRAGMEHDLGFIRAEAKRLRARSR